MKNQYKIIAQVIDALQYQVAKVNTPQLLYDYNGVWTFLDTRVQPIRISI